MLRLWRRIALVPAAAVLVVAGLGGTAGRSSAGSDSAASASRLVAFRSCGDLLGYVKSQAAPLVSPWGFGRSPLVRGGLPPGVVTPATAAKTADTTPTQGIDYSGTNVQEQGVDEPDSVKTNGATLFAVAGGRLNAVDVTGTRPHLLDSLTLDAGWSHELLLAGDRLLVLSRGGYWLTPLPAATAIAMPYLPAKSVLSEIDVSNPKALRLVRTLTLDGGYVDARLVGSTARIVVSSQVPTKLPFEQPLESTNAALATARSHNQAVVRSSRLGSWLPGRPAQAARPLVQCRNVDRPQKFSGLGMLTVLTVDVAKGLVPVDSISVMTDARIVYASLDNLYLATERWSARPLPATPTEPQPSASVTTAIHRFDISDPARTRYRGSGQVAGYLLNQWSLSEYNGVLRVVSTSAPAWFDSSASSESSLTTLRPGEGALTQIGQVGNLGKGERVYAVRYVGPTAYVVTFKQVDPLYTVDLKDPANPRVLGELELPGYSAYLHPIGAGLLLGIGQDVTPEGRLAGTQLSLFDTRRGSLTRRSARAGRRRNPTTMPSSSGRPRASSSCRSISARWAITSRGRRGSTSSAGSRIPPGPQLRSRVPPWWVAASSRSRTPGSPRTALRPSRGRVGRRSRSRSRRPCRSRA